jgi:hypothetical protein
MASVRKQRGVTDLIAMQEGKDLLAAAFAASLPRYEVVRLRGVSDERVACWTRFRFFVV